MDIKPLITVFNKISRRSGLSDSVKALLRRTGENRNLTEPPPPGTPLLCSLGCIVEHSGIYLGDDRVAELRGDGLLREVTLTTFLNGDDEGKLNPRTGKKIFAACDEKTGRPLGSMDTADIARRFISRHSVIDYNIITNNCHLFTASCIMGDLQNRKGGATQSDADGSLWVSRVNEALHAMADDEASSIKKLENVIASRLNGGQPISWIGAASMDGFRYELSQRKKQIIGNQRQITGDNDTSSV